MAVPVTDLSVTGTWEEERLARNEPVAMTAPVTDLSVKGTWEEERLARNEPVAMTAPLTAPLTDPDPSSVSVGRGLMLL